MKKPMITTTRQDQAQRAERIFTERYLEFQYRFVDFFVDHITDVNRVFEGDLQKAMLLAVVGQVRIRAYRESVQAGNPMEDALRTKATISASRLSDITGVPRQTVRRKMEELRKKGWVTQLPDGSWTIPMRGGDTDVRRDLNDINERGIARVARLYADLDTILDSDGGETP